MITKINNKIKFFLNSLEDNFTSRLLRALYATIIEANNGYLTLHAKGLVYTTLVSLVPILAISFALLQYFGVHNQVEPFLQNTLEPLGEKGLEISRYIINFIDNINVGLLGVAGTIILLYTAISTITQIEETLNHIWHVKRNRPWLRRIIYYLATIIFSPALVFTALLLTASLTNISIVQYLINMEPFGTLYLTIATLIPYIMTILAFSLVYKFLPNTNVSLSSAFLAGLSAALVWKFVGYGFAAFLRNSSNYDVIYSGFAALIIFLLWLYISWLIFLLGGHFAHAYQNAQLIKQEKFEHTDNEK